MLVDRVVMINELVDSVKHSRKVCLISKVDLEKAYDTVSQSFLKYRLIKFGFNNKLRSQIRLCFFFGNIFVLVNDSPTQEIKIQRGLKQGDPLAPFLFLHVAEGLNGMIRRALDSILLSSFRVDSSSIAISHLQYADDTFILVEPSVDNFCTLKVDLRDFEQKYLRSS